MGDHVTPFHSPSRTVGEWIEDPYGAVNYTYTGPGKPPLINMNCLNELSQLRIPSTVHNHLFLDPWRSCVHRAR
jgi:hypothetical protein